MTSERELEALAKLFVAVAADLIDDFAVSQADAAAAIDANWNIYEEAKRLADKPEAGQREGVELPEAPPCPVWLDDASKAWGLGWEACRKEAIRRLASAQQVGTKCWCETCRPQSLADMRFIVCPDCGNKRCPRANDHRNACTNSNEPGQPGSSWEHVKRAGALPEDSP